MHFERTFSEYCVSYTDGIQAENNHGSDARIEHAVDGRNATNLNQRGEYSDAGNTFEIINRRSVDNRLCIRSRLFQQRLPLVIVTAIVVIFFISAIITGINYLILPRPGVPDGLTEQPVIDQPTTEKPKTETPTTEKPATEKPSTEKPTTDMPGTDSYEFINRSETYLQPANVPLPPLELPVKVIIIAHTATRTCTELTECLTTILNIQTNHFNRNFDDIGLNFMVAGDGRAYEGAGYYVGIHTKGFNNISICISFIGNFGEYEAPQRQILAAQRLIADGVKDNKIDPEYKLYGQIQINGFSSPGAHVYNVIKTWDHWSDTVV